MMPMPPWVWVANRPSSLPSASLWMPKALGTEGPVISASSTPTFLPRLAMAAARVQVTVDLPTPPLPLTTAITFLMWDSSWGCFLRSMGAWRSPQLSPQEEQSWVQSLMGNISFFQLGHSPVK